LRLTGRCAPFRNKSWNSLRAAEYHELARFATGVAVRSVWIGHEESRVYDVIMLVKTTATASKMMSRAMSNPSPPHGRANDAIRGYESPISAAAFRT
jgi:hypothetical protein